MNNKKRNNSNKATHNKLQTGAAIRKSRRAAQPAKEDAQARRRGPLCCAVVARQARQAGFGSVVLK